MKSMTLEIPGAWSSNGAFALLSRSWQRHSMRTSSEHLDTSRCCNLSGIDHTRHHRGSSATRFLPVGSESNQKSCVANKTHCFHLKNMISNLNTHKFPLKVGCSEKQWQAPNHVNMCFLWGLNAMLNTPKWCQRSLVYQHSWRVPPKNSGSADFEDAWCHHHLFGFRKLQKWLLRCNCSRLTYKITTPCNPVLAN